MRQIDTDSRIDLLLVEDDEIDAQSIRIALNRTPDVKFQVNHVTTFREALSRVHDACFDAVLLDLGLPDSLGLDAVTKIKQAAPSTPVIVLTGHDDCDAALEAIGHGAQEYLSKEHIMGHLLTRVLRHSIVRQNMLLVAQEQALTDPLTSIGNRRAGEAEIERRLIDLSRYGIPVCTALLDVDHFKRVNDCYGHDVGDHVLKCITSVVQGSIRDADVIARYGGEEFAVVFPVTKLADALRVAQRFRMAVEKTHIKHGHCNVDVTLSVGVTEATRSDSCQSVLRRADEALYAAKQQGRNRCLIHDGSFIKDGSWCPSSTLV